jgi:hypothetical protein
MSEAVHRSLNKLWRSSSIFNLCMYVEESGADPASVGDSNPRDEQAAAAAA